MHINQLSPYIRLAIDSVLDPSWTVPERVIWDYELLYLMEGQLEVRIESCNYIGIAGDFFFFQPGQRHSIRVHGDVSRIRQPHVHFDLYEQADSPEVGISFKTPDRMTAKERGWFRPVELDKEPYRIPPHFRPADPLPLEQALFELIREFETKPPYYELRVKSVLLDLLAQLMREQYYGSKIKSEGQLELLSQIRTYIDHNVHRSLKLDELADRFHISKFYLIHLYKQMFQLTPIQYHQQLRMERAKLMLQSPYHSVQDIADQLGYSTIHAFSRAFKGYAKCSPTAFRIQSE
ncbi:helix-turn-helix transcriptional regulator [Paenibacillus koleovorans]|uniref:helix-turn-helix transcriptional regulator n=1 Tax=Paenibacillus koleovorans TaxID=121608 RepID=UPI000FDCB708|nr:AraC family transcriptional regulator [Paenibacillus koleovorans]